MTTTTIDQVPLPALREALRKAVAQRAEAQAAQAQCQREWTEAAGQGDNAKTEALEGELGVLERRAQRLAVQCDALGKQVAEAEAAEQANHALVLQQEADAILAGVVQRLGELERLAGKVAELTAELRKDHAQWRESQFLAKQAGAVPNGFSSQENAALVHRVVESLSHSKNHIAGTASMLGQLGMS